MSTAIRGAKSEAVIEALGLESSFKSGGFMKGAVSIRP